MLLHKSIKEECMWIIHVRGIYIFQNYLKFNIKLSPLYIFLCLVMTFQILLGANVKTYIEDMAFYVIPQYWFYSTIPNLIYLYRNRGKKGNLYGFLGVFVMLPIQYIVLAIVVRVIFT